MRRINKQSFNHQLVVCLIREEIQLPVSVAHYYRLLFTRIAKYIPAPEPKCFSIWLSSCCAPGGQRHLYRLLHAGCVTASEIAEWSDIDLIGMSGFRFCSIRIMKRGRHFFEHLHGRRQQNTALRTNVKSRWWHADYRRMTVSWSIDKTCHYSSDTHAVTASLAWIHHKISTARKRNRYLRRGIIILEIIIPGDIHDAELPYFIKCCLSGLEAAERSTK